METELTESWQWKPPPPQMSAWKYGQWRMLPVGLCILMVFGFVAGGFFNQAAPRWKTYRSAQDVRTETGLIVAYPTDLEKTDFSRLKKGQVITFTPLPSTGFRRWWQETILRRDRFKQKENQVSVSLLSRDAASKDIATCERSLREAYAETTYTLTARPFRHPLGPGLEMTVRDLSESDKNQEAINIVLILPEDTPAHRRLQVGLTLAARPEDAGALLPLFEKMTERIRLDDLHTPIEN